MKTHALLDPATLDPAAFTLHLGVFLGHIRDGEAGEGYAEAIGSAFAELGGEEWASARTAPELVRELGDALIDSRFRQRGTCDHCGAWFKFGMVYRHTSGALVVVGNTCAHKSLSVPDRYTLVLNRVKAKVEAAKKAAKSKAAALKQAAEGGFEWLYTETHTDHILTDIAAKGLVWSGLSPRQIELVQRIRRGEKSPGQIAYEARQAQRAAEDAAKTPVIEGRIVVTGVVKAVKYVDGYAPFGPPPQVKKLIVRDDRGFTVWLSCPTNIYDVERGARITVKITVTKGDKDPCFGFGKRPSNAEVLEAAKAAA